MLTLSFRYRKSSDLHRRTFHVDLTVNGRHVACQVIAPDALEAEQVVRKHLPILEPGILHAYSFDLIREVLNDYDRKVVVRVPLTFEHALTVSHR